jgi:DeoR/GlpR family transcriptional regulator of sugar metabolism
MGTGGSAANAIDRGLRLEHSLLPAARRQAVLEVVLANRSVTVVDLAKRFGVSAMTIRRDLQLLEAEGVVESIHGGARSASTSPFELSYVMREMAEAPEKRAIAAFAASLVADGASIALDGSSTCGYLARALIGRRLSVVTNNLKVATELGGRPHVDVTVTGGRLLQGVHLIGPFTGAVLDQLRVETVFFSATAITDQLDLMAPGELEAEVNRRLMGIGRRVVLLADSTKFGRHSFVRIAPMEAVHAVVVDGGLPSEWVDRMEAAGVRVHVAPVGG